MKNPLNVMFVTMQQLKSPLWSSIHESTKVENPSNVMFVTIQQLKSSIWSDIHEPTRVKNLSNVMFVTIQQLEGPQLSNLHKSIRNSLRNRPSMTDIPMKSWNKPNFDKVQAQTRSTTFS